MSAEEMQRVREEIVRVASQTLRAVAAMKQVEPVKEKTIGSNYFE